LLLVGVQHPAGYAVDLVELVMQLKQRVALEGTCILGLALA
jgi:hypothetical protein